MYVCLFVCMLEDFKIGVYDYSWAFSKNHYSSTRCPKISLLASNHHEYSSTPVISITAYEEKKRAHEKKKL